MQEGRGQNENIMADKTPVRVVFNSSNVATGMAEFQSGETVPVANGGTGLASIGSAGQVLRTNAAGNALEFATLEDLADIISVGSTLTAPSNADFNITTAGTGNIVLNDLSISDNTLSTNRSNDDLHINASGTGTVVLENLKIGSSGSTVTTILDEDNMSSNSATSLATQQSIKAYVDGEVSGLSQTSISQGDSNVTVVDSDTGNVTIEVDGTDRLTTVAATTTTATGHSLVIGAGSNSAGGQIKFLEGTDNGTNGVTLLGPASTADVTVTLPAATDTLVGKATTDTFTNKTIDANGTGNSISNIDIGNMTAAVVVTESEGISSNDNDTTLPTSAAVRDYADTKAVLSGSTNNQITTVTGAHAIQGESNLTFDGSTLAVTGAVTVSGDLAVDTNTLFVDVSTNRVGVGSTTLSQPFTIHDTSSAQIHLRTANPAIRFSSDEAGGSDSTRAFIGLATNSNAFINGTAAGDLAVRSATDGKILLGHSGGEYARLTTSGATFTAGVTATTGTFSGNVAISGDLTVSGDTTTVSTTNTAISDNILELNTGISQSFNDAGIIIERGSTGNNAAIIWDESADTFVLGTTTATAADKSGGITIDAGSLKIASLEADGVTITDNTIGANASNSSLELEASGTGDIDLNAGADVNIPANIGLTFGDDGEKIEGDGTDLTISSSGDVIMKLTGEQLILHDGTSNIAQFDLTSNNLTVATLGNDKDMFFKGVTGASQFTALTLDMSAAGAATFNDKIVLGTNKAIEFVDTNESIQSDGSKMIIKSGGTTFNLPTADGTAGQALVTDGSGTLSFDSVATTVSDDGLATVKSNKHLGSTARTLDSINATFIDSAFYFFVLNDIVNETISAEMFAVTNNDTASFLGNRRGIESSGGDNVPTLATDVSNGQYRVRVTGTSADCRGSFYKVAMSSSTTDATRGNTVTSSNTDVDSASESVDTFAHATFRGAKYFISVDNDSKTEMEVVEALVVHDGTNAFISQYGHTTSGNNSLVTLTAAISGDNVVVSASGLETNLNLTMHKILLKDNMTAQSNANQKAFAAVTVSSSATAIDLMDIDEANGAVHFIVGANASEGAYSIQEVYTAATPGVPAVANGPFVSTKGTRQLDFTAAFDTSSENSLELFASSTSGGSTTVSGYRISALAG